MIRKDGKLLVTAHEAQTGVLLCPDCQEELVCGFCHICNQAINAPATYQYQNLVGQLDRAKDLVDELRAAGLNEQAKVLATTISAHEQESYIKTEHIEAYEMLGGLVKRARESSNPVVRQLGIKVSAIRYVLGQVLISQ